MRDFTIGLMFALFISGLGMMVWDNAKASTDVPVPTNPEYVVLGTSTIVMACDGKVVEFQTNDPLVIMAYLMLVEKRQTSDEVLEFILEYAPMAELLAKYIHNLCMPGTHT